MDIEKEPLEQAGGALCQSAGGDDLVVVMELAKDKGEIIHRVARILYWVSLLMLLIGMRVIIDPNHRKSGETSHIYLTLAAFEIYMWLLLWLARWQIGKQLHTDTVRSGIFATALMGVLFIALNELHIASVANATLFSIGAVVLTFAKLGAAKRWIGFAFPLPMLVMCFAWVLALAIPAPLIRSYLPDKSAQHVVAYFFCWLVAFMVAGFIPLIKWQINRGWSKDDSPARLWWICWLVLAIMAILAIIQLYAVMWGMFVDWADWYFSPIFLALGIVAVSLSHSCRLRYRAAWVVMILAVLYAVVVCRDPVPRKLSMEWLMGWATTYITDPIYTSGVFVPLLFLFAWLLLGHWWMLVLALAVPFTFLMAKASRIIWTWRHGKGVALLFGAFISLGFGVALQWWQERKRAERGKDTREEK